MHCSNCGNKRKEGDIYCTHCGNYLEHNHNQNSNIDATSNYQIIMTINIILGILSLIFITTPILSISLAIISIVLSSRYRKEPNKPNAGAILGIISIILTIGYITTFTITALAIQNIENKLNQDIFIEEFYQEIEDNPQSFDISGYSWLSDDHSILYLNKDKSYTWYEKEEVQTDNFYQGKYEYYTAEEAMNYITNYLPQFGVTEEEQQSLFEDNTYLEKDYYLIILECNNWILNGQAQQPDTKILYYYGFYNHAQNRLNLVNMNTKSIAGFTLKEKIIGIDI